MQVAAGIEELRRDLASLPRPLGFVPTMGALHAGHLALVEQARQECASVAASVFVNPLQFAPGEDLDRYPRDFEGDQRKLDEGGVNVLFAPAASIMYPKHFTTAVDPGPIGLQFEGAVRPTHFRGVATVVTKLLSIVGPDVLYLGQKDAQQTAVLRRVVRDLSLPVNVRIIPTVREADGLALSSRNVYLTSEQREAAPSLRAMLVRFVELLQAGGAAEEAAREAQLALSALAQLDYLALVHADTFEPLQTLQRPAFAIAAARFGKTRLLDNEWLP